MEDFSAPSFSLGLDLQSDGEDEPAPADPPQEHVLDEGDEDAATFDPDSSSISKSSPRSLKRLRRGPPPLSPPPPPMADGDDDIEDVSSQEDPLQLRGQCSLFPNHNSCGSSKLSLQCNGILTRQTADKLKLSHSVPARCAMSSVHMDTCSNKKLLPKLTVSPLRKFMLLDDSDDAEPSERKCKEINAPFGMEKVVSSADHIEKKDRAASKKLPAKVSSADHIEKKDRATSKKLPAKGLWKDLNTEQTSVSTPVFDDFCKEYFSSGIDTKSAARKELGKAPSFSLEDTDDFVGRNSCLSNKGYATKDEDHTPDLPNFKPPAYQYFFNDDPRIRTLVRERLSYFVPLGTSTPNGMPSEAEDIDYLYQFAPSDIPNRTRNTYGSGHVGSSKKTTMKDNISVKQGQNTNADWVNPRSKVTIPKDAAKRRVQANDLQSGSWFTNDHGIKVYVNKNGQELTGRLAYTNYIEDRGTGFRNSKKKATAKKTHTRKRKRVPRT